MQHQSAVLQAEQRTVLVVGATGAEDRSVRACRLKPQHNRLVVHLRASQQVAVQLQFFVGLQGHGDTLAVVPAGSLAVERSAVSAVGQFVAASLIHAVISHQVAFVARQVL